MYRKVNARTVVSDDKGFEVFLSLGDCIITYREGEKLLRIKIERGSNYALIHAVSAGEWDRPSGVKIDDANQERILNNVKGALDVLNCPYRMAL